MFLQEEEKSRNKIMFDIIYVHDSHTLAAQVVLLYQMCPIPTEEPLFIQIDTSVRSGCHVLCNYVELCFAVNYYICLCFLCHPPPGPVP